VKSVKPVKSSKNIDKNKYKYIYKSYTYTYILYSRSLHNAL